MSSKVFTVGLTAEGVAYLCQHGTPVWNLDTKTFVLPAEKPVFIGERSAAMPELMAWRRAVNPGSFLDIGRPTLHGDRQPEPPVVDVSEQPAFEVGQLVESSDPSRPLRSGCETYSRAVVVQASPLVLVSEHGCMRWETTLTPGALRPTGVAAPEVLQRCMRRL